MTVAPRPFRLSTPWFTALQLSALVAGLLAVIGLSAHWPIQSIVIWGAVLVVTGVGLAALAARRLTRLEVVLIDVAALASASAALNLQWLHYGFKPLTMGVAMALVSLAPRSSGADRRGRNLLLAALLASMAGDVFLMWPANLFIAGLASFLIAHLCYIALFSQGLPWFPSRTALVCTLTLAGAMLTWLWGGLHEPLLKIAVPFYVGVIALMAAQALGRAQRMRSRASRAVALGACVFMLSDALIAIDRFVHPLPMASLWVLATYYTAQILIVLNVQKSALPIKNP